MKKREAAAYLIITILILCIMHSASLTSQVEASENVVREKVIISIVIKEGDTLWSVASEYYTEEYSDMNELIHAIKKCNGISDKIKIGQKLLIPYYRTIL